MPYDRKRQQQFRWLGREHHFCLADLGHRESRRSQLELLAREAWNLMRLGVRPETQAVLAGVVSDTLEIALHHVQIDQDRGRVELVHSRARRHGRNRSASLPPGPR